MRIFSLLFKIFKFLFSFFSVQKAKLLKESFIFIKEPEYSHNEYGLEMYLNTKLPKWAVLYNINGKGKFIDVRMFLEDNEVKEIRMLKFLCPSTLSTDEVALECLQWVIRNIRYIKDFNSKGKERENWRPPHKVLQSRSGDCEDMSCLLASIMIAKGIPYYKVRLVAGDVNDNMGSAGGHVFVMYYCEETKQWVILDPCFYPNTVAVNLRNNYKNEGYYKTIWFSWNKKYCFAKSIE